MMNKITNRLALFFGTRAGHALLAAAALLLAYVFASWAIDSGSLLDWAITVVLLVIVIRELSALIRQIIKK